MSLFRERTAQKSASAQETISLREHIEARIVTIRDFLERLIDERDKQYDMRFRAAEIAVQAALLAEGAKTKDAFAASEKAIVKAEQAQTAYNVAHNDLSRKMDDQYKTMMPHVEAIGLFRAQEDKVEAMRLLFDSKMEAQRLANEKSNESLLKEISSLRESRSESGGAKTGSREVVAYLIAGASILLALVLHFIPS